MKRQLMLVIVVFLFGSHFANAQTRVETEYLGSDTFNSLYSVSKTERIGSLSPATQEDELLTSMDRKVMKSLTGVKKSGQLIFHYRPSDLSSEALEKAIKINVEKFEQCEKLLKMKYRGSIHLFLYKDTADMRKTSGVSAAAFATGTASIHQPVDFQSVHELTHIFALQFPKDKDAVTDSFAVEGLATILAESDQNVPIHSWVAVYKETSRLPDLIEYRHSWPKGGPKGVHPYHVAGSFVGYLIDQHGIEKVKRWYVNSTEAHMVFGKTVRRLEREWLAWLDKLEVKSAHRDHVFARLGLKRIPDKYVKVESQKLFDGKSLDGFKAEDSSRWKVENGRIVGTNPNSWTRLHTSSEFPANVGVRAKLRLKQGDAIQIRLNRSDESNNESVFAKWGTYLSLKAGGFTSGGTVKIVPGEWTEIVLVNDHGTARLYINGILAKELKDQFHQADGTIGLGIEKGTVEVSEFSVFEVKKRESDAEK